MKIQKRIEWYTIQGSQFIDQLGFHDESKSLYVKMIGSDAMYGYQFTTDTFYSSVKFMLTNVSAKVVGSIYGGVIKNSRFKDAIALLK